MKNEAQSPLDNAVIWHLTNWARRRVGGLKNVHHHFCPEAEEAHKADRRLYAHSHDDIFGPGAVCWSRAIMRLMPNTVAGICLHEFGHILAGNVANEAEAERAADLAIQGVLDKYGIQLRYRGKSLLQWVDFGKLLREINRRG